MQKYLPTYLDEFAGLVNRYNRSTQAFIGETDESILVEVPLPGVSKEQIHLGYENGFLTVKAEEKENGDDKFSFKSCRTYVHSRTYDYQIAIPTGVDEQAAPEAQFRDGILRVRFPKSRAARPYKIEIK